MEREREISRRDFIRRTGTAGALMVFVPLCGCGGEKRQSAEEAPEPVGSAASDPCADLTGLSEDEKEFRDDAGYLAETPDPSERCDNCEYWEPPAGGKRCGKCTVIAGPIHPGGYCDLWEAST